MSNDPAANLANMRNYLDDARDALGPGHVIVDEMMLSDWCSALARAIGEADGSTLAAQQDAIALLRAEIERLRRDSDRHNAERHDKVNENAANYHHRLALEAERDALRDALKAIIKENTRPQGGGMCHDFVGPCALIAIAALEPKP